ncbi:MAG: hypothetical protein GFH27_549291n205 [Chloroflexi bacterium AL-W]|nr:hypothetical protein [Chloroflexi bacterium AL-N1]NOK67329.1 hypothetical protein [Chloroflexi bacterium AL-N10]NOK75179.1 hypothetical protein [Chloroflexi bacterium AL-N5]NOK81967.1 hypothetical protein [Chloroflexi bacterium AL-W]NOK89812.1 hypothetical protein [Chloroflexi bacterium AL-N15]
MQQDTYGIQISTFVIRPVLHHFILWIVLAPIFFLEAHALHMLTQTMALQNTNRTREIIAEVVDSRMRASGPQIRYQFSLPDDTTRYTPIGSSGLSKTWIPVTQEVWQETQQRNGTVPVVYLADNPHVSQPVGRVGYPVVDSLLHWAVFLVFDLVWLTEMFIIIRNFLRSQAAVERRMVQRFRFWEVRRRHTMLV